MTKAMLFAENNVNAAFDLAQKLVRAKDVSEVLALQVRIRKVANGGGADSGERAWRGCTGRYRLGYPKVIHAIFGGHRNSIDSGQLAVIGIAPAVISRGSIIRRV